jgi:hypothetical protein
MYCRLAHTGGEGAIVDPAWGTGVDTREERGRWPRTAARIKAWIEKKGVINSEGSILNKKKNSEASALAGCHPGSTACRTHALPPNSS